MRLMLALALTLAVAAAPEEDSVVEDTAVKNKLFQVERRWEAGLIVGFPTMSRLTEHYVFDAHVAYNVLESLAVEAIGGWAYSRHTSIANGIAAMPVPRTPSELSDLWEMTGHGLVGASWQPLYGKIGVFSEAIHFQLYAWLGAGGAYFRRTPEFSTNALRTNVGPLFSVALGGRLFWSALGDHHALRIEARDFSWIDSYVLSNGSTAGGLTNLVQLSVGYTFLF
jgi:outer membrane beta-barrel protein